MDHSAHHLGMDGDMDMGGKCNMNMLFTFSTENLCIVFPQWRITGPFSLLLSLVAVILLSAGYEGVREFTRRYEASQNAAQKDLIPGSVSTEEGEEDVERVVDPGTTTLSNNFDDSLVHDESSSLLFPARNTRRILVERKSKIIRGALYAVQVFYSFFIMLLFMTYNGWIMLSVAIGAFVGYMVFGNSTATKSVSCH